MGASKLAIGWSALLPYPHYLALAMDQSLGAPPSLALRPGLILLGYTLVAGGAACLLLIWARQQGGAGPAPRAPIQPEAADAPL